MSGSEEDATPRQIGTREVVVDGQKVTVRVFSPGKAHGSVLHRYRYSSGQKFRAAHPDEVGDA